MSAEPAATVEDAEPLTVLEVCAVLNRPRRTVDRWIAKGTLRAVKSPVTNRVFVPLGALAELAKALAGEVPPAPVTANN